MPPIGLEGLCAEAIELEGLRAEAIELEDLCAEAIELEGLRAEARDVPTASSPSVMEAGEARACAASAARPNSAERSEAASSPWSGAP